MPDFIDLETNPSREFGGFLAIQRAIPIHESIELGAESLVSSWKKTNSYINEALKIIHADEPPWLDAWEAAKILEELGRPPVACLPIYLVSIGDSDKERLVYVGKTSSSKGRFQGGHKAFTKLHHPKYSGEKKTLYLAALVLLTEEKDYLPLEWVKPLVRAEELLCAIEAQLIYEFKPELNTQHVNNDNSRWPVSLHIQNVTGVTDFLHDRFCWPSR